jgi:SnoaL-like polyketide cyclase
MAVDREALLARALIACIKGDAGDLEQMFTDDVIFWSPNLLVDNLDDLRAIVGEREGSLTDLDIEINSLDVFANKGFVEYRLTAKFTGPFALDEDIVIEPNDKEILLGACVVAEFVGDKISAVRNYFDDATLLEQMLD